MSWKPYMLVNTKTWMLPPDTGDSFRVELRTFYCRMRLGNWAIIQERP